MNRYINIILVSLTLALISSGCTHQEMMTVGGAMIEAIPIVYEVIAPVPEPHPLMNPLFYYP